MVRKIDSEKDVKSEVKKLLDIHKWFWWMPPANAYGKIGISDFHALRNGVFMVVETKYGSNTPTIMQKGFLSSIHASGGFSFVVNEVNLERFATWMTAFDAAIALTQAGGQPSEVDGAAMLNAMRELMRGY